MNFYKYAFIITLSVLLFLLFAPLMNETDDNTTDANGNHPIVDKKSYFEFLTKYNTPPKK